MNLFECSLSSNVKQWIPLLQICFSFCLFIFCTDEFRVKWLRLISGSNCWNQLSEKNFTLIPHFHNKIEFDFQKKGNCCFFFELRIIFWKSLLSTTSKQKNSHLLLSKAQTIEPISFQINNSVIWNSTNLLSLKTKTAKNRTYCVQRQTIQRA
jgi:hypothetical protein